jgi:hypothetical protein
MAGRRLLVKGRRGLRQPQPRQQPRRVAARQCVVQQQLPAMQVRDRADERQPEPGAGRGARGIRAEEPLPRPRAVGRRQPRPAIRHPELHDAARRLGGERDAAALGRELDGVVEQVGDRLQQEVAVPGQRQRSGQREEDALALRLRRGAVELGGVGGHLGQVERAEGGAARACLGLGDAQERMEDADDGIEVGDAALHRAAQRRRVVARRGQRLLQPRARAGERGAEVMRQAVGDAAHALHQRADAVEHGVHDGAELVELVAAAGEGDAPRQVAARDRLRRAGGGRQPRLDRAPQQRGPQHRDGQRDGGGEAEALGEHAAQPELLGDVAPDQQLCAVGQGEIGDARLRPPVAAVAAERDGVQPRLARHRLGPDGQVAGEDAPVGRAQQIDVEVLEIEVHPLVDRGHERQRAVLRRAGAERGGVGADRGVRLAVERARRAPPHHGGEGGDRGGEQRREQQREPERRAARERRQGAAREVHGSARIM